MRTSIASYPEARISLGSEEQIVTDDRNGRLVRVDSLRVCTTLGIVGTGRGVRIMVHGRYEPLSIGRQTASMTIERLSAVGFSTSVVSTADRALRALREIEEVSARAERDLQALDAALAPGSLVAER